MSDAMGDPMGLSDQQLDELICRLKARVENTQLKAALAKTEVIIGTLKAELAAAEVRCDERATRLVRARLTVAEHARATVQLRLADAEQRRRQRLDMSVSPAIRQSD